MDIDREDPNDMNMYGRTPLYYAAGRGDLVTVKYLLDHGANPNVLDSNGNTILSLVLGGNGNTDLLSLLLEYDSNTGVQGSDLIYAAMKGVDKRMMDTLLQYRDNMDDMDRYGWTALMYASDLGSMGVARSLLEHGASPYIENTGGETASDLASSDEMSSLINSYVRSTRSGRNRGYMSGLSNLSI